MAQTLTISLLFFKQLCKFTDDDHPEKPELLSALDGMRELAQTINEVKRDLDTISAIDQIQARSVAFPFKFNAFYPPCVGAFGRDVRFIQALSSYR